MTFEMSFSAVSSALEDEIERRLDDAFHIKVKLDSADEGQRIAVLGRKERGVLRVKLQIGGATKAGRGRFAR